MSFVEKHMYIFLVRESIQGHVLSEGFVRSLRSLRLPLPFGTGTLLKNAGQLFCRVPFSLGLSGVFSQLNSDYASWKQASHRRAGVFLGDHTRRSMLALCPIIDVNCDHLLKRLLFFLLQLICS